MATKSYFDALASHYDRVIKFRDTDKLVSYLELPIEGLILDACGGTGRASISLIGKAKNIIVADQSMGMVRQAGLKNSLSVVCNDIRELSFIEGQFERIMLIDAFHHLMDQAGSGKELWRVLKPGGKLLILEPDIQRFFVRIIAFVENIIGMNSRFLTPAEIVKLFRFPNAKIRVNAEKYRSWIIIEKGT